MAIILYPHVCTTLLFGLAMPNRFDWEAGIVFVAALSAVVFFMMGGNLLLARALSIAIPAGERLTEIARGMSARTGVRLNSICELRISQVNAVAFPSNRCIAFTGGLLPMLTDEEIAAVAGHELAHLAESRKVLAFRRLLMAFLPLVALNPVTHRFGFGGAAGLGAGVFLFLMFGRRVAARLETSADVGAKKWEPQPAAYAKALEKLHRAALLPAVMPARVDIHRNLYDRMVSAGVQPAFPRPSPPSKATFRFAFLGTLAAFFTCMLVLKLLFNVAGHLAARAENPVGLMAVMTLDGGGERRLQTLSRIREAKNDLRGALVFAKAAVEAGAHDHRNRTHVASLLAAVGRCDEAAISLEEARKLGWQHASDEPEEVSIDAGPDAVNMEAQDARKAAAAAARTYVDALPEIRKATEAVAKCKGSASPR
ncbi:MAG: M48 family metalloprotease [Deltaproteobacteria bacterium]|nr:M48 family metalloprotease [Deltaproteobacteria bacterium]